MISARWYQCKADKEQECHDEGNIEAQQQQRIWWASGVVADWCSGGILARS
jgi:hypothetical protein